MSTQLKTETLNLFQDNIVGDISASDIRTFVNNIFDSKENTIYKRNTVNDIGTDNQYIDANDLMIILNGDEAGLYLVLNSQPNNINDLQLLYKQNDTYLPDCPDTEQTYVLSCTNQNMAWTEKQCMSVHGRLDIQDILNIVPNTPGVMYIANNTDLTATIPGHKEDVYSWDGCNWHNIGRIFSPQTKFRFSAADGQQDFDCLETLNDDLLLFVGGSLQDPSTYTINGSVLHYNTPLSGGTDVLIIN